MALVKSPRSTLPDIRQEFDRMLNRFFGKDVISGFPFETSVEASAWMPAVDLSENEKEYLVTVEAAGIPRENLDVRLDGDLLTISGHRESRKERESETWLWKEREEGRFVRTIRLPGSVTAAEVEAHAENGVLKVRLPKSRVAPENRIVIK